MRVFLVLLAVAGALWGEESAYEESARKGMEAGGCDTEGMAFQQVGKVGLVRIFKEEKVVGYYYKDVVWEPAKVEVPDGVTRIEFGNGDGRKAIFTVTKKDEIAMWLKAYERHSEKARFFSHRVPLTDDAGFAEKREEYQAGATCMCPLGLYFYKGDEQVLKIEGHLDVGEEMEPNMRNAVLHALVVANKPEPQPEPEKVNPDEYAPDPWVDDEEQIGKWVQKWVKAFDEDDPEKMMKFYEDSEDLDMLVSIGRWHHGADEARKAYERDAEVLDYYDSKAVGLKTRYLGGNYALVSFRHHFKYRVKGQGTKVQARIRTTMTLKWLGGSWKIVQEHSSPLENVPRAVEIQD